MTGRRDVIIPFASDRQFAVTPCDAPGITHVTPGHRVTVIDPSVSSVMSQALPL